MAMPRPDRPVPFPALHGLIRCHQPHHLWPQHSLARHCILLVLLSLFTFLSSPIVTVAGQFSWQKPDAFDKVQQQLDSVNGENCKVKDVNGLFLPTGAVSHIPDLQWIGINPVFPNRTNLLQVHNMALSRAFFLRYVYIFFLYPNLFIPPSIACYPYFQWKVRQSVLSHCATVH